MLSKPGISSAVQQGHRLSRDEGFIAECRATSSFDRARPWRRQVVTFNVQQSPAGLDDEALRWVTGQKTRARKTVNDMVLVCRGLQQIAEGQESLFPMFLIPAPVFVCSFHFSLTLDYNFHIRVNLPTVFLLLPVPRRWRKPIILHDDGLTQHCTTWGSSAWLSCLLDYIVVRFPYIVTHHLYSIMSLTVKSLNGDTSFLLTFDPPAAPLSSPGLFPGSFTILLDRECSSQFLLHY
jgi:hypothetical protein